MSSSEARRTRRLMQYRQERSQLREENEKLIKALEEAVAANEQLQARPDHGAELEQLRQAITEGATRAAWETAALAAGVRKDLLDDLWTLDPPKISETGEPDPKALAAHVAASIKTRPLVVDVKPETETETETAEDDGDQVEQDLEQGDDGGDFEGSLFELAPPVAPAAPAAAKGKAPAASAAKGSAPAGGGGKPKLTPGAGGVRGARDAHRADSTTAEIVDREFRDTGRSDAFRI